MTRPSTCSRGTRIWSGSTIAAAASREPSGQCEEGFPHRLAFACHELTPASREGLIEGAVDIVVATPTRRLAEKTVAAMVMAVRHRDDAPRQIKVPFEIYVSENV